MADSKITALTSISTSTDPANDPLVIVDVSDTSMATTGTTKKVTLNQLLGASGTATLASATITGNLTVQSNVNAPASVSFRYGPSAATWAGLRFDSTNQTFLDSDIALIFRTGGATSFTTAYTIGATGISTWSVGGSTAMTLNSTGLGVGTSPSYSIQSYGTAPAIATGGTTTMSAAGQIGASFVLRSESTSVWTGTREMVSFDSIGNGADHRIGGLSIKLKATSGASSLTEYLQINPTYGYTILQQGNLGIGVTPSAWNSSYRGLQLGSGGAISAHTSASLPWLVATSNSFINSAGDWKFINNGYSTRYLARGDDGTQSWWTSNNGLAGGTVAYTQAMTLDASGNLLVGKSVSLFSTVGVEASGTGFISATNSASTNATTNLSVYSTGAAAFRFYVGLGGTVYATNTTISAISDQRLKENVQDIDVGLGAILALKPRKFDWKAGKGKDIKGDRGFIAQEFEQVFPQLVDEWKDEAPEGEAPYKSVRQDLIPVLVKAIQELTARVQTLETR